MTTDKRLCYNYPFWCGTGTHGVRERPIRFLRSGTGEEGIDKESHHKRLHYRVVTRSDKRWVTFLLFRGSSWKKRTLCWVKQVDPVDTTGTPLTLRTLWSTCSGLVRRITKTELFTSEKRDWGPQSTKDGRRWGTNLGVLNCPSNNRTLLPF